MSILEPVTSCAHRQADRCNDCSARLTSVCSVLTPAELLEFEEMSRSRPFRSGDILVSENEPTDYLFTVTEGMVRLYRTLTDGRRQIFGFAMPGDFLGLSLLNMGDFTAEAVTAGAACKFPRADFIVFVDANPRFLRRLHEMASGELRMAQDQMVLLGRKSAEQRVAAFIVLLRRRLRRTGDTSKILPLPMSRQDIADYLGLTIETVSRTITKLCRDKLIAVVPHGLDLLKLERLEALAAD